MRLETHGVPFVDEGVEPTRFSRGGLLLASEVFRRSRAVFSSPAWEVLAPVCLIATLASGGNSTVPTLRRAEGRVLHDPGCGLRDLW